MTAVYTVKDKTLNLYQIRVQLNTHSLILTLSGSVCVCVSLWTLQGETSVCPSEKVGWGLGAIPKYEQEIGNTQSKSNFFLFFSFLWQLNEIWYIQGICQKPPTVSSAKQ